MGLVSDMASPAGHRREKKKSSSVPHLLAWHAWRRVQNLVEYLKYVVDATPQTWIVKEHVPCTMASRERASPGPTRRLTA